MVRTRFLMLLLLLPLSLALSASALRAQGAVYRDKNGKLHIGDTPPAGQGHTVVEPSRGGYNAPRSSTTWAWVPVPLAFVGLGTQETRSPQELYETLNKSVWTVIAAASASTLERGGQVSQGSAVAVSQDTLLTNCHVVQGRPYIVVRQMKTEYKASVVSGDVTHDRCVLALDVQVLEPVPGHRTFASLAVGEKVYTLGSPKGLANSMGEGLISGLREVKGRHFVQTTAQVSPGSSGGGLFDPAGNLIGITVLKIQGGEGLNFAIAVEDYTR
ncbi:MAG: S1C family serine protease [Candidatus Tectimicrobiota bacterium]